MNTNRFYCIVPGCKNSSVTENKHFFNVPKYPKRKKWCQVIRRDGNSISGISSLRICEDHFNIEQDTENYMQYKIMHEEKGSNVRLRLKPDVLPHIFPWQEIQKPENDSEVKRKRKQIIEEALKQVEEEEEEREMECVIDQTQQLNPEPEPITIRNEIPPTMTKSTQTHIKPKFRSIAITVKPSHTSIALSPPKFKPSNDAATSPIKVKKTKMVSMSIESNPSVSLPSKQGSTCSSSFVPDTESQSLDSSCQNMDEYSELKNKMRAGFLQAVEEMPKPLLGIPQKSFHIIKMLSERTGQPPINIMITLKKIKLNDSFLILGLHFGYSESMISLILKKTITLLAHVIKDLIIMPSKSEVVDNLPIAFRARFNNVFSIIDCFEVEIEKPSNALHQALTWSQYKGCNTLKYLISITPDGLITFISEGYGGRASDVTIVEKCGYLDKLPPNVDVMADRGFKSISHLLHKKNCMLIRPPSVSKSTPSSKDEVKLTKRIAALRIHVERAISRIREFNLLLPHSRTDNHLAPMLDKIIVTACGIINMQDFLVKI